MTRGSGCAQHHLRMAAHKPSDRCWIPRRGLSYAGARCNRLFLLFGVELMGLDAVHSSRRLIVGERRDVVTVFGTFARRTRSYLIVSMDRAVTGAPGIGPAPTIAARLSPTPADPDAELSPL
jgi:hypothetical protein